MPFTDRCAGTGSPPRTSLRAATGLVALTAALLLASPPVAAEEGHPGSEDTAQWPEWARTDDGHDHDHDTDVDTGDGADADGATHEDHGAPDGHGDDLGPPPQRPRELVLGSFAVVNGGVLLVAAVLRRRARQRSRARGRPVR